MSKITARVATTGVVEQGGAKVLITKEAIDSIPHQVNGDRAIPYTIDHDPFCLPVGKIESAWVEPYKDGYAALVQIHQEDSYSKIDHERSGAELVTLEFKDSPKPFLPKKYGNTDSKHYTLSVDSANFAKTRDYEEFISDIKFIDNEVVCNNSITRHSLGPEPLIQIEISNPALAAALGIGIWVMGRVVKFVTYTIDETLRKTADDFSDVFSNRLKDFLRAYKRRRTHDNRPSVAKIVIPTTIELVLLMKTQFDDDLTAIDLRGLVEEMEKYGDILQEASSATFAQVDGQGWRFEYCTTRSGKVIGSLACYERTRENMERVGPGVSLGGYAALEKADQDGECSEEEQNPEADDAWSRD